MGGGSRKWQVGCGERSLLPERFGEWHFSPNGWGTGDFFNISFCVSKLNQNAMRSQQLGCHLFSKDKNCLQAQRQTTKYIKNIKKKLRAEPNNWGTTIDIFLSTHLSLIKINGHLGGGETAFHNGFWEGRSNWEGCEDIESSGLLVWTSSFPILCRMVKGS